MTLFFFSNSGNEHLAHVHAVLEMLKEAGLTAKARKCEFGASQCVYLGHVVGSGIVKPDHDKTVAIQAVQCPQTKTKVRVFLGITGYYRRFIKHYSTVAAPLSDLTRRSAPNTVKWTQECEKDFRHLKQLLCSTPILKSPNFDKQFILQTDASDRGVGAVLSQKDDNNEEHPVAYWSKKLLPREQKYSTIEKECLAIKLGICAFRVYLMGCPFIIETDHRSLQWMERLKETNNRLARWSLALQPYWFTVNHRPGKMNGNVDGLSRATNQFVAGEGGRDVMEYSGHT